MAKDEMEELRRAEELLKELKRIEERDDAERSATIALFVTLIAIIVASFVIAVILGGIKEAVCQI